MLTYDFNARLATGEERRFTDYRGKVLLIVNVASKCDSRGTNATEEGLRFVA